MNGGRRIAREVAVGIKHAGADKARKARRIEALGPGLSGLGGEIGRKAVGGREHVLNRRCHELPRYQSALKKGISDLKPSSARAQFDMLRSQLTPICCIMPHKSR